MKRFNTTRLVGVALGLLSASGFAETLLPTADTFTIKSTIHGKSGASGSMIVSKSHTAFIQFGAASRLMSENLTSADILGARLTLYFPSVIKPGKLGLHVVNQAWSEKFKGSAAAPTFAAAFATIPAESVIGKNFVTIDVTAEVQAWLNGTADDGFAVDAPDQIADVFIGAKEGPGSGYPATLEIETTDVSSLFQNPTNGNIGIGTLTPTQPLDINVGLNDVRIAGNASSGGSGLILENSDTSAQQWFLAAGGNAGTSGPSKGFYIQNFNTGAVNFSIAPSGAVGIGGSLSINNNLSVGGRVGIGTTTPTQPLDVNVGLNDVRITGQASFGGNGLILENTDTSTQQWFLAAGDNAGTSGPSKGFYIQNFNSGIVPFFIAPSGLVGIGGNLSVGNRLGIGTTAPTQPLDVNVGLADVRITGRASSGGSGLILENTDVSTQQWFLAASDNAGTSGPSKGFYIQNFNNGIVPFSIAPSGLVGIGGTMSIGNRLGIGTTAPTQPLDVNVGFADVRITGKASSGGSGLILENTDVSTQQWFLGAGDNAGTSGSSKGFYIQNFNNGIVPFSIAPSGLIGIGVAKPTRGRLEVVGSVNRAAANPVSVFASTSESIDGADPGGATSIFATDQIVASAFVAISDARVKTIQGRSDAGADLQTLRRIEITNYHYKDVLAKGNRPQKKVIAQQVEAVFPQAVNKSVDVVPDLYVRAPIEGRWVKFASGLAIGDRVRLIDEKTDGIYPVLEVKDGAFRTDFPAATDHVFVYGREVSDFRTVDYDAIAMLNVSATQELARQLEMKDSEIKELREADEAVRKEFAAAEKTRQEQNAALEARLTRLESQLAPASGAAHIVAFTAKEGR